MHASLPGRIPYNLTLIIEMREMSQGDKESYDLEIVTISGNE